MGECPHACVFKLEARAEDCQYPPSFCWLLLLPCCQSCQEVVWKLSVFVCLHWGPDLPIGPSVVRHGSHSADSKLMEIFKTCACEAQHECVCLQEAVKWVKKRDCLVHVS